MITDENMATLIVRAQQIMQAGMARNTWLPEREFVASPVTAVVLAELIRDERAELDARKPASE